MNRPALSISTAFDYNIPIEEQIPAIAAAGFSHVSLGAKEDHSGYLTAPGREHLRNLLRQNELEIDTLHAPCCMDLPDSAERLIAVARAAAELNIPVVVVHAGPFAIEASEQENLLRVVLQTGQSLETVSRETGTIFAVENVLPGPATELAQASVSHLDPACFGFCYDSSHDQIDGPNPFDLLGSFSRRLFAVHLSDRIAAYVDHVLPGEGFIDWAGLTQALRQADYDHPLLFEVAVTHSSAKEMEPFLELAYRRACQVHQLLAAAIP
ncbi:MAG: sugar phosphate isomerase/epimerase [Anaerolineae bacterium]|nr:sugar phosphate isomerase/epimerase [Anaerolineae bacterium]